MCRTCRPHHDVYRCPPHLRRDSGRKDSRRRLGPSKPRNIRKKVRSEVKKKPAISPRVAAPAPFALPFPLAPKLCLGTHSCEAPLRSLLPDARLVEGCEAELPAPRPQAELGDENDRPPVRTREPAAGCRSGPFSFALSFCLFSVCSVCSVVCFW